MVPDSSTGCAFCKLCTRDARRGSGGGAPSSKVGASEGETCERGIRVGASDPETPEGSTTVGASDGGGRSDGELPLPEGVRTAAPVSCCVRESASRRGRPCSPMVTRKDEGNRNSRKRGNQGAGRSPCQPPAREIKVYTSLSAVSAGMEISVGVPP